MLETSDNASLVTKTLCLYSKSLEKRSLLERAAIDAIYLIGVGEGHAATKELQKALQKTREM